MDSPNMERDSQNAQNALDSVQLPPELLNLSDCLEQKPEALATGNTELQIAALKAAKHVFDMALKTESTSRPQLMELLQSMAPSEAPKTRSQTAAESSSAKGKRKRSASPGPEPKRQIPVLEDTPLPELCIEGMDEDQLWTQLDLRAKAVCDILEFSLEATGELEESDEDESSMAKKRKLVSDVGDDEEDLSFEESEHEEDEDSEEDGFSDEDDDEDDLGEEEDGDVEGHLGESTTELRDPEDSDLEIELDGQLPSLILGGKNKLRVKRKTGGHPVLDDGFFDLAAFNAETEAAEARKSSRGKLGKDDDDEEDDSEDEGIDYFASVDDDAEADDGGELFYKDFFEPPSRTGPKKKEAPKPKSSGQVRFHEEVRVRNIKPKGKGLPVNSQFSTEEEDDDDENEDDASEEGLSDEDENSLTLDDNDLENGSDEASDGRSVPSKVGSDESEDEDGFQSRETIDRLKDDLFASDSEDEPESDLTTHQKRVASLQEEIAQLESENVSKKHWTLMGEATSRSRPQNALLEEDLEFERVMKSIPVITEETVQGLEDRIKARILEGRFDDVVRRRPVDDKPFLPSRFFELQDTKSKQSLAEIYEEEYTATQTGGIVGEDRDGKLAKEHKEIEKLWDNICYKLDALSNAHFTPKAPKATISTISNVSAASMESALPTTMATSTMLAPEEVFTPSSNDLVSRSELTPTQKRALHNKQKKAKRKARDALEKSVDKFAKAKSIKGVKQQKDAALKGLVKTGKGVTVIGKKSQESGKKTKRTGS